MDLVCKRTWSCRASCQDTHRRCCRDLTKKKGRIGSEGKEIYSPHGALTHLPTLISNQHSHPSNAHVVPVLPLLPKRNLLMDHLICIKRIFIVIVYLNCNALLSRYI